MCLEYVETLTAYTINSGATESYSYAGNQRLSRNNIWDEAQGVRCNQTSYYLYDGRGSVTANTWYNGMVTDVYQYDPYGQVELGSTKHTDFYGYNAESYNPNSGLEFLRARYYNANQGRFFQEDTYLGNIIDSLTLNRYAYVKNSPMNYVNPSGHVANKDTYISDLHSEATWSTTTWTGKKLIFKVGEPERPEWEKYKQYDADFEYDPKAKPTVADYANWIKWEAIAFGANAGPLINRDLEDASIKTSLDNYLYNIMEVIDMISQETIIGCSYSVTSNLLPGGYYPSTENWQKAIGGHSVWISADVQINEHKEISAQIVIHELDRYNFNQNNIDIVSGTPDEVNGRFEELGWAKSFNTYGEVMFNASWKLDNVGDFEFSLIENTVRIAN